MNEKESRATGAEAQRDIATHPDRPLPHMGAIGRYLAAMAYADGHPHGSESEQVGRTHGVTPNGETR